MRTSRIYTPQSLAPHTAVELDKEASHHLATVLRAKSGDPVVLFNGEGGEYAGELSIAGKKVTVALGEFCADDRESPLRTVLGIGISRGERFEWVLQKAAELGVSDIYPLVTERTEVKLKGEREEKKLGRWQQVIISACEQCGRNRLPNLHPTQSLADWQNIQADLRLVLHHRSAMSIAQLRELKPSSVAMAIGPEGGLSAAEIQQLHQQEFRNLTLGPRVLRTETAPLTALSIFQALWGDF